eukprot:GILK01004892.1.p1 GENE.GILK01004892.1~~GILK01004892.1.p1  ORF type:complete len:185 (-),score=55.04 GILK01004892.1:113-667(-)
MVIDSPPPKKQTATKAKSKQVTEEKEKKEDKLERPLAGLVLAVSGRMSMHQRTFTPFIESKGAMIASDITDKVDVVLSTPSDVSNGSAKISTAKKLHIPVVAEDFIHEAVKLGDWRKVPLDDALLVDDKKVKPLGSKRSISSTTNSRGSTRRAATKRAKYVDSEDEDEVDSEDEAFVVSDDEDD